MATESFFKSWGTRLVPGGGAINPAQLAGPVLPKKVPDTDTFKKVQKVIASAYDSAKAVQIGRGEKLPWEYDVAGKLYSTATEQLTFKIDIIRTALGLEPIKNKGCFDWVPVRTFVPTPPASDDPAQTALYSQLTKLELELSLIRAESKFRKDLSCWILGSAKDKQYEKCHWVDVGGLRKLQPEESGWRSPEEQQQARRYKQGMLETHPTIVEGMIAEQDNLALKSKVFLSALTRTMPKNEEEAYLFYKYCVLEHPVDLDFMCEDRYVKGMFDAKLMATLEGEQKDLRTKNPQTSYDKQMDQLGKNISDLNTEIVKMNTYMAQQRDRESPGFIKAFKDKSQLTNERAALITQENQAKDSQFHLDVSLDPALTTQAILKGENKIKREKRLVRHQTNPPTKGGESVSTVTGLNQVSKKSGIGKLGKKTVEASQFNADTGARPVADGLPVVDKKTSKTTLLKPSAPPSAPLPSAPPPPTPLPSAPASPAAYPAVNVSAAQAQQAEATAARAQAEVQAEKGKKKEQFQAELAKTKQRLQEMGMRPTTDRIGGYSPEFLTEQSLGDHISANKQEILKYSDALDSQATSGKKHIPTGLPELIAEYMRLEDVFADTVDKGTEESLAFIELQEKILQKLKGMKR